MHTILESGRGSGARKGRFDADDFRALIPAAVSRAFGTLLLWQRRANQRRALASLDDRMLRDLGMSRSEVAWESRKPFWRA